MEAGKGTGHDLQGGDGRGTQRGLGTATKHQRGACGPREEVVADVIIRSV